MTDVFSSYERGLEKLLGQLGKDHPRCTEALTLQARLLENIAQVRRYGDTETRRAERAQIVEVLNRLAVEAIGKNFNEWCGMAADEEVILGGLRSPSPPLPPRRKQPMRKKILVLAFILSTLLSLLVGLLSNVAATYLAPPLADQPWLVYSALIVTFVTTLPVSVHLFLQGLHEAEAHTQDTVLPHIDSQLSPQGSAPLSPLMSQLPDKKLFYRELVGRDVLVGDLMAALRDRAGRWIVAVDGMGGIDKTALALEVADRCRKERLFDVIVWESASRTDPTGENRQRGQLTFKMILDAICRELGVFDLATLKEAEKESRVRALLHRRRILVVLDNLETAKEPQNEMARRLRTLLDPSKALMTSRRRFTGDLYRIYLTGLDEDSALRFIRQEADEKRIGKVATVPSSELKQVAGCTGGSPLAMKFVVGQLEHQTIDTVLSRLREIRLPEGETNEDDYIRFYKFIFFPSWRLLSEEAKDLLVSMANFTPEIGETIEGIEFVSEFPQDILTRCIDELWRLSFLEVGQSSSLRQVHYYLHPLTQYFVLADIVKCW